MTRFLYRPILIAIDAREYRIAAELADADPKNAEAQKERDAFKNKIDEFDQQHGALISRATNEAKAARHQLIEESKKAVVVMSAKHQETLRNDSHILNQAIRRLTQQEVFAIARKTLADLAATSLEKRCGVHSPRT